MAQTISFGSCSTFLLKSGGGFLLGHNLDERTADAQPGSIYLNKRGERKTGISFEELYTGLAPGDRAEEWVAQYGSVTFSSMGKDFIDGGYNEAGLYIQEMSQEGGQLQSRLTDGRIRIFMSLWMQYVLDNYACVKEVLQSLEKFGIDGWSWHFFVADKDDNHTCIDFIDGCPRVYSDGDMPYAVMTNYPHDRELENLGGYAGFGGSKSVDLSDLGGLDYPDDNRFVHACHLIKNMRQAPSVDDAFHILYAMDRRPIRETGGRQWSYVIDTKQSRVYVETYPSPRRRYFDFSNFDFGKAGPSLIVDIHLDYEGDMGACFQPVTAESNRMEISRCTDYWLALFDHVRGEMEKKGDPMPGIFKRGSWKVAGEGIATALERSLG